MSLFKLFQKVLSLSLQSVKVQSKIFCRFPSNFFKGFWLLRSVRPFCPSFFFYFHVSCIFFILFGKISNLRKIGVFIDFNLFFQNWSLGFCYEILLNWSLWFNLINLLNWGKLNFLGLGTTRIWDFVQLSIILWNWLVWLIELVIIFCYLSYVMINWSFCWDFWKWVFKILVFFFFYINSMLKPIL